MLFHRLLENVIVKISLPMNYYRQKPYRQIKVFCVKEHQGTEQNMR